MNAVVRTDKMFATDNRAGLVSVRTEAAIDNGNVLAIHGLEEGSREVYVGVAPITGDTINNIVLVASPELMYDEHKHNLDEFQNAAGSIARGYRLHSGDVFSVTKEALVGEPAIDATVTTDADTSTKLAVGGSGTPIGKIIDIEVAGRYTYYVIQVA